MPICDARSQNGDRASFHMVIKNIFISGFRKSDPYYIITIYLLNIGYYRATKFRNRLRCPPGGTLGNAHSRTTARPRPLRQKSADTRRRFLDRCLSSGLGGSPRRPCRGQRQPRQSLRRESRDQEGDAGSLSGLSTPLQAPVPVSQLVIHSPAPVVPALVAAAGQSAGMRFLEFFAPKNWVALCYRRLALML